MASDAERRKLDELTASPRTYKCFVKVTIFSEVTIEMDDASGPHGRDKLMARAIGAHEDATYVEVDLERDIVECNVDLGDDGGFTLMQGVIVQGVDVEPGGACQLSAHIGD